MDAMLLNTSFDQDISRWNLKSVTGAVNFLTASDLSTENYDALLNAWSQNPELVEDLEIGFGSVQFSAAGKAARDTLINDFNWVISDGGEVPN